MKYDISVIVPFYKRDKYAIGIFKNIEKQAIKASLKTELIFVDANSRTILEKFILKQSSKKYFNCKILDTTGYVSNKRNLGIRCAQSEYLIIMDDDCVPDNNFLREHYNSLSRQLSEKLLFCGTVRYDKTLIKNQNYFRFRDAGHRKFDKYFKSNRELNFHNIVTMNMSFKKKEVISNNLFFNENYNEYGFEDIQFGIDGLAKGFTLMPSKASVIHQDSTPLSIYYKKLCSFSKNYYILFYDLNIRYFKNQSANNEKEKKIINDIRKYFILAYISRFNKFCNKYIILKLVLKVNLIIIIPLRFLIVYFLTFTNRNKYFYSKKIYKFLIIISYLESFLRKQKLTNSWIA